MSVAEQGPELEHAADSDDNSGYDSSYGDDGDDCCDDSEGGGDVSEEDCRGGSMDSGDDHGCSTSGDNRSCSGGESGGSNGGGGRGRGGGVGKSRWKTITAREYAAYRMMEREFERDETGEFKKTFSYLIHCWRLTEDWLVSTWSLSMIGFSLTVVL